MITQYKLMLERSADNHPHLVKEASLAYASESLNNPDQITDMLNKCFHLAEQAEEYVYLLALDTAGHPLGVFELSHGTVRETAVGIREMFIRILLSGGSCFAVAHNHPSGQVQPSSEDRKVCRRIKDAADIMGIPMLDFIIIGTGCYLSYSREGLL